ncbi:hypothetical protein phiA829_110 [Aeromonas phage phiA8-29]|uniref:Uncharacterized protein n=1 Tax=Aeromonas phage phiA8-29 TaxID=1978922 RepID=A0A1W6DY50_9CAUD|nr:hypothetical protein HWB15_gp167 [Aeromonas phage phiA8-29]ARK07930.1 hypothetical protein phiA829_110 [Aeromonas phage phiA8-29]
MKDLVLTHTSGCKFVYTEFGDHAVISDLFRTFQSEVPESIQMSLPSFRKLLKDFGVVKGWTASVTNQATVNAQEAIRKATRKDEERSQRKRDKKAKRMAERSLKNGSRSFMRSQAPKKEDQPAPFRPKINPLFAAMLGSGLSGRGR